MNPTLELLGILILRLFDMGESLFVHCFNIQKLVYIDHILEQLTTNLYNRGNYDHEEKLKRKLSFHKQEISERIEFYQVLYLYYLKLDTMELNTSRNNMKEIPFIKVY